MLLTGPHNLHRVLSSVNKLLSSLTEDAFLRVTGKYKNSIVAYWGLPFIPLVVTKGNTYFKLLFILHVQDIFHDSKVSILISNTAACPFCLI